jgi:hypothetical protein
MSTQQDSEKREPSEETKVWPWVVGGLAAVILGRVTYRAVKKALEPNDGVLGTDPPSTPPTVVSNSADAAGYNRVRWANKEAVEKAFGTANLLDFFRVTLGYGSVTLFLPGEEGSDPMVKQFQDDWNLLADAAERGEIKNMSGIAARLRGRLEPSGRIDVSTLNALEIALPAAFGWRFTANLMRQKQKPTIKTNGRP